MAIAVRGTSTGVSNNSTTTTISLPAGVAVGDVSFIVYEQVSALGTPPTVTPPAGWTVELNVNGTLVCWRAFQAGDATTGISASSNLSNWWLSLCTTYSGLDTASPIDAQINNFTYANPTGDTFSYIPLVCRAPSLCPNFMGSQLLCVYTYNSSAGRAIGLPAGLTARVSTATGPNLRMCDKALTDGTPTGAFDATVSGTRGQLFFGMQIALKASGAAPATLAAARPEVVGTFNRSTSGISLTLPLTALNVRDGDMVVAAFSRSGGTIGAPGGYVQQTSLNGALIYTYLWRAGDTLTPAFTMTGAAWTNSAISLVRVVGVSALPVSFDKVGTATNTGAPATVTIGTQTPSYSAGLLLVAFGSTTTTVGTWSGVTAGLTDEAVIASGPGFRWSWMSPATVPTGAFAATWTTGASVPLDGAALLLRIGASVALPSGGPMVTMIH
jgi:hypothetical protein